MENIPPSPGTDARPQAVTSQPEPDHERRDASIGGILWFAFALTVTAVVVHLGLGAWMTYFNSVEKQVEVRRPELFDDMVGQYAGPRLQDNPARDMETYTRAEAIHLNSYGWIEPGKVARIPIERAIDLLVERGLPKTPPPASNLPGPSVPSSSEHPEESGDSK